MTAPGSLAHIARQSLAQAAWGTLHIHSADEAHGAARRNPRCTDVLLYDDGGQPTFLCEHGSGVIDAAKLRHAAILSVSPVRSGPDVTGVVLAGQLAVVGTESVDGTEVTIVGLGVHTVVVELDDPRAASVIQREVPLADYRSCSPDSIADAAQRLLRHANSAHAVELRTFVADLRAVATTEIAAAELCALDLGGVDVRWLDRAGAHTVRIEFPAPADSPTTLAARLRETFVGTYD